MANLPRSAKSASEWTKYDMAAYNLVVQFQDEFTFFGIDQMPAPMVDRELLTTQHAKDVISNPNFELISLLELAMRPLPTEDSAANDFAMELLRRIGYATRPRLARSRKDIPLFICDKCMHAKADVCLLDSDSGQILLLVQADKSYQDMAYPPQPQLFAAAIAAFDHNNRMRKLTNTAVLEYEIIPGIVLFGTSPIFYKIPVTSDLAQHVGEGTYPPETTTISAHVPSVSRPIRHYTEGMMPLDNRQVILSCYEAFKGLLGI